MKQNELVKAIDNLVDQCDHLKNAYFWTPPKSAAGRRAYEKKNSCDKIEWTDEKDNYSAELIVDCSAKNIYVTKNFFRNGKKTTLLAIRNSLERLRATL